MSYDSYETQEIRNVGDFSKFHSRQIFALIVVLFCFCILAARFFWLQITQHEFYQTRADTNRISLIPVVPNRGIITDRNNRILAYNYSAFTLEITPSQIKNLDKTIDELATIISIESKDRKRFKRLMKENKNYESVPIRNQLTEEEIATFTAERFRFPGVEIKARLFRRYPYEKIGAHALGYISRVSEKDEKWIEKEEKESNYKGTEHIGKTGIEQHYEFELHGETGWEQVETDAGGNALRNLKSIPPISGNNLKLTLDIRLQEIAEKAFGEHKGALVAIEPETGGILALVSVPSYDPNLFIDGISSENWKALNFHEDKPMINRTINGAYPPGSTFKPFMALAALETGKRKPQDAIRDPGYFNFGGHTFRDDKVGGHGIVDMHKSIVHSCDTYYYVLANDMGIDRISAFMKTVGFGQKTGIDLGKDDSGESKGVLPSKEWKLKRFKNPAQQKWYAGETISIGIGQGYNAYTPIQLASATATLANYGIMFRPHLVNYIEDKKINKIRYIEPKPLKVLGWKRENVEVIHKGMMGVMTGGTGYRSFYNAPYTSAGKTGTAQVFSLKGAKYNAAAINKNLRDHALFTAFAPVENPKIALAVLVENGGFGASTAAPIARKVMDYYLLKKRPKDFVFFDEISKEVVTADTTNMPPVAKPEKVEVLEKNETTETPKNHENSEKISESDNSNQKTATATEQAEKSTKVENSVTTEKTKKVETAKAKTLPPAEKIQKTEQVTTTEKNNTNNKNEKIDAIEATENIENIKNIMSNRNADKLPPAEKIEKTESQ